MALGATGEVEVRGLAELQRAFKGVSKDVAKNLRDELARAAIPVKMGAENNAIRDIRNLGPSWGRMRIGVTPGAVYVAPSSRRRGGSPRGNLAPLLMTAMQTSLEENEEAIVLRLEQMLDNIGDFHGF